MSRLTKKGAVVAVGIQYPMPVVTKTPSGLQLTRQLGLATPCRSPASFAPGGSNSPFHTLAAKNSLGLPMALFATLPPKVAIQRI